MAFLFLIFLYSILGIIGSLVDLKYDSVTESSHVARLTDYNLSLATIIWIIVSTLILAVFIGMWVYKNKILKP